MAKHVNMHAHTDRMQTVADRNKYTEYGVSGMPIHSIRKQDPDRTRTTTNTKYCILDTDLLSGHDPAHGVWFGGLRPAWG